MSPERRRLALRASSAALRVRQKAQIVSDHPCNVFDLAEALGIEVRLAALPSAEGILFARQAGNHRVVASPSRKTGIHLCP